MLDAYGRAAMPTPASPSARSADRRRLHRTQHPGIYTRGASYVLIWRHQGRQHKRAFGSLDEALAEQARQRAGKTDPRGQHALLLRNYARDWLETHGGHNGRGFADSTREDYRRSLETQILPRLGHHHLSSIRPRDIRGLVRDMEEQGLKPGSIRKHTAVLRSLFQTAVADRDTPHNPAQHVHPSSRNRPTGPDIPRSLTTPEIRRLLAELEHPWDLLAEFFIHTGLRIGEAIALTWEDLDLEAPRARVRVTKQVYLGRLGPPKTPTSNRTIPLAPTMTSRLAALRDERAAQPGDLVFPGSTGRYLDPHNLRTRILRPAATAAGLQRVTPHTLRHTCASLLFENGHNIKQVQEWLGHSDPSTTLRTYIHLADRGTGGADIFDQLLLTS